VPAIRVLALFFVLLAGCGGVETSPDIATDAAERAADASSSPTGSAGRSDSLKCGEKAGSASLSVDYPPTVTGLATPAEAARALADESNFPRSRYTERTATGSLGQPVVEYVTNDGRVVAYVKVQRLADERWLGNGLTVCQSAYSE
jgi:hypothetical protein